MSAKGDSPEFEPLPMRRRSFAVADANQYQVRMASGEIKEIKADTAYEAVIRSGQADIIKIERVFNSRQSLFDQSKLAEDALITKSASQEETIQDRINRRKNPIISASELDELMRASRDVATVLPQPPQEMGEVQSPTLQPAVSGASLVMEPPPVPILDEPIPTGEGVGAVGLDLHGDGFDEIIPAAPQVKTAKPHHEPKPAVPAESAVSAGAQVTSPENELSAEEVEKLLQNKPE